MSDKLLSLTCKIKFSCIECPLNDYFALTGSAKDTVVPSPRRSLPSKDTDTSFLLPRLAVGCPEIARHGSLVRIPLPYAAVVHVCLPVLQIQLLHPITPLLFLPGNLYLADRVTFDPAQIHFHVKSGVRSIGRVATTFSPLLHGRFHLHCSMGVSDRGDTSPPPASTVPFSTYLWSPRPLTFGLMQAAGVSPFWPFPFHHGPTHATVLGHHQGPPASERYTSSFERSTLVLFGWSTYVISWKPRITGRPFVLPFRALQLVA
jgi:hypothetical protein